MLSLLLCLSILEYKCKEEEEQEEMVHKDQAN